MQALGPDAARPRARQAFLLYEEAIPDSAAERTALASIVGALQRCTVFPPEPRAALVHKATGYSAKLLRKPDQCRAVLACSRLFWQAAPAPAPPQARSRSPLSPACSACSRPGTLAACILRVLPLCKRGACVASLGCMRARMTFAWTASSI